jgi:hypothetical protein
VSVTVPRMPLDSDIAAVGLGRCGRSREGIWKLDSWGKLGRVMVATRPSIKRNHWGLKAKSQVVGLELKMKWIAAVSSTGTKKTGRLYGSSAYCDVSSMMV